MRRDRPHSSVWLLHENFYFPQQKFVSFSEKKACGRGRTSTKFSRFFAFLEQAQKEAELREESIEF